MSIISKETWDNLPEEEKEKLRQNYSEDYDAETRVILEDIFGKENLQPEPKIKTWEDVLTHNLVNPLIVRESAGHAEDVCGEKIGNKVESTLKIAALIELGYGGMVSDEEWLNEENPKYVIKCTTDIKPRLYNDEVYDDIQFVAFHTDKQRNEFMSYPENVKLVEQYYML